MLLKRRGWNRSEDIYNLEYEYAARSKVDWQCSGLFLRVIPVYPSDLNLLRVMGNQLQSQCQGVSLSWEGPAHCPGMEPATQIELSDGGACCA
ncbi:hypothetical protein CEXT_144121 [Caerostris extrusa]|uniref:Uncharacterized protein n=1 Tax=Caerostris extrusa TaxID=172846 RepID=A0AAV4NX23_CAEEX|nr:hypothetical protein CEXT_144121 [Caerostris extrusa]